MGNKVKYNLKNVHAAKLTKAADNSFTYGTPKPIPGAVSISLEAEGESSPFYADGIVYFRSTSNNGYSGDLEIALIPEWFRTEILKEELDKNGILVEKSTVNETEKFAYYLNLMGMKKPSDMSYITVQPHVHLLNLKQKKSPLVQVQKNSLLRQILEKMDWLNHEQGTPHKMQRIKTGISLFMSPYLKQKLEQGGIAND